MGATALALLRAYRRTALLLAAVLAVALGAGLPVALATGRLAVGGLGPPLTGLDWTSPVTLPGELRQQAVDGLFGALFAAAGAVVGVAGLTLIALAAARMSQREREVAVRRAVGASRRTLLGGLALEGAGIAAAGAALGLPPGLLVARLILDRWPGQLQPGSALPVLAFGGVPLLLVLGGALFPILFARRPEITEPADVGIALKIPALLLGTSLAVLATGLLLTRHMMALTEGAGGAVPAGRVYRLHASAGAAAERSAALEAALARAATVPAVARASLLQPGALMGLGASSVARADCGPCWPFRFRVKPAAHFFVSADSFDAMGVRLLGGRAFTAEDRFGAEPVAIVNAAFAREQFAGGEAIGKELMVGDDPDRWYRIVGVVEDGPPRGLGSRLRPEYAVYLSLLQHPPERVELLLPTGAEADRAVAAALATVPGIRLAGPGRSLAELLRAEQAPLGWFGPVFAFEGLAMLLLATVGTFALIRLWVTSLAGEIAVWRAVGARRRRVHGRLLGRAALAGAGGVALGGWLGPLFWEAFRAWLPGLGGWEAGILLPAAGLLLAVALLGAFLPTQELLARAPVALFGLHDD